MLKLGVYCAALHPHSPWREREMQEDFKSLSKNVGIFPWLNPQVNLHVVKREAGWSFMLLLAFERSNASSWAVCFSCANSSSCDSSVSNSSFSPKSHKTRLHREKRKSGGERSSEELRVVMGKTQTSPSAPTQNGTLRCLLGSVNTLERLTQLSNIFKLFNLLT